MTLMVIYAIRVGAQQNSLRGRSIVYECRCLDLMRRQGVMPFDPQAPVDDKFYLYHVEAGTRIWELYARLDEGDPHSGPSLAAELRGYLGPWAMPTLGGAGGQTIVGAFSTGTHGGDVHLRPIADAVQAVHLIGPQQKEYWIESELAPGVGLVDEALIGRRYPGIEVVRDEEVLNSVIVAVGRMGVIYSVVLRVVRQYALQQTSSKDTWSSVRSWITNISHPLFTNNHFVQVVVNPNSQVDNTSEHSCFISGRTKLELAKAGTPPLGRAERGALGAKPTAGNSHALNSDESLNKICDSPEPLKVVVGLIIDGLTDARNKALLAAAGLTAVIFYPLTPPPVRAAAVIARDAAIAAAAIAELIVALNILLATWTSTTSLGVALSNFANWAAANDHLEYLRQASEYVLESQLIPSKPLGPAISYAVMDGTNYLDLGCVNGTPGDSLEVFFDASSPALRTFIDRLIDVVDDLENGHATGQRLGVGGWVSLRFMKQTAAVIGMQKWDRTCAVEIACPNAMLGTEPLLAQLEALATASGATVHWGQRNNLNVHQVERAFGGTAPSGDLYHWRRVLSLLSRNGRDITFRTQFSTDRGLEVVQPLIGDFIAIPSFAPAGAPIFYSWDALDNPPGTTAHLDVVPLDPPGPRSLSLVLPTLKGNKSTPLRVGKSQLVLTAAYTRYGRTLTAVTSIEAHRFNDGDEWTFDAVAECQQIDGQARWAVELTFDSVLVSDRLCVAALRCSVTNASAWYARTPGQPDLSFTQARNEQTLSTAPVLNKGWLFFVQDAGCQGATPQMHVVFTIVCEP